MANKNESLINKQYIWAIIKSLYLQLNKKRKNYEKENRFEFQHITKNL